MQDQGTTQEKKSDSERRKLKRRYLMFYSRVFDRSIGKMVGYLSDMTVEGLMVISEDPSEPGKIYRLRIDLPEDDFDQSFIHFEAKCVWSERDVNPNFYMNGFQLNKIDPKDIQIIEKIIEDYGFRDQ